MGINISSHTYPKDNITFVSLRKRTQGSSEKALKEKVSDKNFVVNPHRAQESEPLYISRKSRKFIHLYKFANFHTILAVYVYKWINVLLFLVNI